MTIPSHSRATRLLLWATLLGLAGCKPAATPSAQAEPPRPAAEPVGQPSATPRRRPGTEELASSLRGQLPPALGRLVELKNDPPVPLPGTAAGTDAWLFNVRLTFAPAEDLFAPTPVQDTQALQALLEELQDLADWSQAYARSPYTDLGATFTVKAPASAAPQLLVFKHAKDQPFAPLYGKMTAAWQVDHWNVAIAELQTSAELASQPRGAFPGATMIQGSHEATHFVDEAQTAIKEARDKQAAIERRYQEALAQATRPGTLYRGEVRLRSGGFKKPPAPAEVRFVDVPADAAHTHQARFGVKLPKSPSDDFLFQVNLAEHLPLVLPAQARQFNDPTVTSLGDATINGARASGKDDLGASIAGLLVQGLHGGMVRRDLPLFVHGGRMEGRLTGTLVGDLLLSAKQAP